MDIYTVHGELTIPSLDGGKTNPTPVYFVMDVRAEDAQSALDRAEEILDNSKFADTGYKLYNIEWNGPPEKA